MGSPGFSRRRLLGLGAGAVAAASVAGCAGPDTSGQAAPPAPPIAMRSGSFTSRFRPQEPTGWSLAVPGSSGGGPSGPLPVALFLHGTGADHRMVFDELDAGGVLAGHVARGGTPFAIAAIDGGETWWHRRESGTDTQSMLVEEFVPLLARQGLDTGRLAVFGLSMGGFGALLLASQHRVPGLRAVAAMSPAVWSLYDAGRSDNFDSAADFAANDIFALRPELEALPKRIDCGTADNLLFSVQDYVKDLPGAHEGGFQAGGHDSGYWRSILPDVLTFLGKSLA
ncbi:alpha/beta hydrolase-fold protein [Arthrobacter sp. ES3-54]|uniref:alpha/beta hydrolase n=1 Tax=Arthrobacter sp. ES3-54 TaxID=1502991 RepID=UPI0024050839|nr:alpha/beta hydrolase-fold protein [Arthrobacter sp. ES3-54]MDF9750586.1 pimeloyl-ACP methyl ester carboxylesterase [Arthrobacter sp. ES3-54]